jgi:hypothetical protein
MDNGINGEFKPVFIGTNRPDILHFTSGDLKTGLPYRFYVQAINENGISQESPISTFYACRNPSGLATPLYVSSDRTAKTIRISWTFPGENGGCTILGFRIFRNDGTPNNDNLNIEVTSLANNDPSLHVHTIDMSTGGVIGNIYKFKIRTHNIVGYVDSNALSVALASLPSKPSTVPTSIPSGTNQYQLKAQIETFTSVNDGGSPILNYEIQYDDGLRGAYKSIITLSPIVTITREINRGRQYRLRYRAQNFNGWGEFSEIGYIKSATVPSRPPAPVFYSSTNAGITLLIQSPEDNGGVVVTGYKLWVDTL